MATRPFGGLFRWRVSELWQEPSWHPDFWKTGLPNEFTVNEWSRPKKAMIFRPPFCAPIAYRISTNRNSGSSCTPWPCCVPASSTTAMFWWVSWRHPTKMAIWWLTCITRADWCPLRKTNRTMSPTTKKRCCISSECWESRATKNRKATLRREFEKQRWFIGWGGRTKRWSYSPTCRPSSQELYRNSLVTWSTAGGRPKRISISVPAWNRCAKY